MFHVSKDITHMTLALSLILQILHDTQKNEKRIRCLGFHGQIWAAWPQRCQVWSLEK